jgi:hypothetical protein
MTIENVSIGDRFNTGITTWVVYDFIESRSLVTGVVTLLKVMARSQDGSETFGFTLSQVKKSRIV